MTLMTQNKENKVTPLEQEADKDRRAIIAELKQLTPEVKPGAQTEIEAVRKLTQRAQFNYEWDTKYYALVNKGATIFSPELHDVLHARVNKASELKIEGADFAGELARFKEFGERSNKQSSKALEERAAALKAAATLSGEASNDLAGSKTAEQAAAAVAKYIKSVEALLPAERKPADKSSADLSKPAELNLSLREVALPKSGLK